MRQRTILMTIGALSLVAALEGCATRQSENASVTNAATATNPGPGMRTTSDLVFEYRKQAADFRDLARRLELEADVYTQRQDEERAKQKRDLAKDMHAAADAADEQAREYRRQLPHNQVN